jgi:DNA-binding Lrp family transcriptional regulator
MAIESKLIDQLKKEHKLLLPLPGLKLQFGKKQLEDLPFLPDFQAKAEYKDIRFKIIGEVIAQNSSVVFKDKLVKLNALLKDNPDLVPIILARYLSPARQKKCRDEGINFIDLSGNAFIAYESLYIERIGLPNRFPEKRKGRGPFSDKASLILRKLLYENDKAWGIRELAGAIGLDPGFVSRMVKELEKRNYLVRANSKIRRRNAKAILNDWAHEYNYEKNRAAKFFSLSDNTGDIIDDLRQLTIPDKFNYALGLHAGASLISPHAVFDIIHIYVQNQQAVDFFIKKLGLKQVDQGENVMFLLPHYKHSVFYNKQKLKGLWVVSEIQLYLDLYNYPIRGREQAEHLYEKRLKKIISAR